MVTFYFQPQVWTLGRGICKLQEGRLERVSKSSPFLPWVYHLNLSLFPPIDISNAGTRIKSSNTEEFIAEIMENIGRSEMS